MVISPTGSTKKGAAVGRRHSHFKIDRRAKFSRPLRSFHSSRCTNGLYSNYYEQTLLILTHIDTYIYMHALEFLYYTNIYILSSNIYFHIWCLNSCRCHFVCLVSLCVFVKF